MHMYPLVPCPGALDPHPTIAATIRSFFMSESLVATHG
jgi:hypothetical protein